VKRSAVDELDVKAAAAIAGRSMETVRRWVWSGRLKARKHGNRLFVARADVEALAGRLGSPARMSLAEWAAESRARLQRPARGRRSASDLVTADRQARSGARDDAGR